MNGLLGALGLAGGDGLDEQSSDHVGEHTVVFFGDGFDFGLEFGVDSDRQVLAGCHAGQRSTTDANVAQRALIRATLDHMSTHESTPRYALLIDRTNGTTERREFYTLSELGDAEHSVWHIETNPVCITENTEFCVWRTRGVTVDDGKDSCFEFATLYTMGEYSGGKAGYAGTQAGGVRDGAFVEYRDRAGHFDPAGL